MRPATAGAAGWRRSPAPCRNWTGTCRRASRAQSKLVPYSKVFFVIVNVARRAHDHNWELDPIVRSLLDTDFYKLLMLQFIWKHFPATRATFALQNRTTSVRLGEMIDIHELREQLEAVRKLRYHKSELIWLAGNTFYGRRGIFEPAFLEWLDTGFRLSDFDLSVQD